MDTKTVITIVQIVVAVLLVISILLQNRGQGLGSFFGGGGEAFKTRRGVERVLYWATIVFTIALVALSLANTKL